MTLCYSCPRPIGDGTEFCPREGGMRFSGCFFCWRVRSVAGHRAAEAPIRQRFTTSLASATRPDPGATSSRRPSEEPDDDRRTAARRSGPLSAAAVASRFGAGPRAPISRSSGYEWNTIAGDGRRSCGTTPPGTWRFNCSNEFRSLEGRANDHGVVSITMAYQLY
jgi:hypothetical protein